MFVRGPYTDVASDPKPFPGFHKQPSSDSRCNGRHVRVRTMARSHQLLKHWPYPEGEDFSNVEA
jgi:hypothetical protein